MSDIQGQITPSQLICQGNTSKQQISFTYDTGFEDNETSAILDILSREQIKCTFFVTGFWVEHFPELAKRIQREGHEIGNHSYEHLDMQEISYGEMLRTIRQGEEAIQRVLGINPRPLFRQPFGSWNDTVLQGLDQGLQGFYPVMLGIQPEIIGIAVGHHCNIAAIFLQGSRIVVS